MKIDAARDGRSTVLRLEGRLDRESAEHLSATFDDLLRQGVRSVVVDFAAVTYVSSAGMAVLTRGQKELAALRGDVRMVSIPPAVREAFEIGGWSGDLDGPPRAAAANELRMSSWNMPSFAVKAGEYESSVIAEQGSLRCRPHGRPDRLAEAPVGADDCTAISLANDVFSIGVGAIGHRWADCGERLGELIGVSGCAASFPSDGARMADYFVGGGATPPSVFLASGLTCAGTFSRMIRFGHRAEVAAVPLSELAGVCLDASGASAAGVVIASETAGLVGTRLRRTPAAGPMSFELPQVRDWISFAGERIHPWATTLIAGVVAGPPANNLAPHLRPLGGPSGLLGHLHAAVFSYQPLPQRTVDLHVLVKALFRDHQLDDVLHLLWDDRGRSGIGESRLLRGVGWVAPIAAVV